MKEIIISVLIGYLVGSIPWGLIIGKVFFHKDIRNYGSGNLGGTNAGRVLGAPIGILVIVLDAMKAFIVMAILNRIYPNAIEYAGLAVCVGHCFPIFAGFRGGKAVACTYGYLLGLAIFITKDAFTLLIPLGVFLICLLLSRIVSFSSIIGVSSSMIYMLFKKSRLFVLLLLLTIFVIIRHSENIKRILDGKESRIGRKK